jgi:hypothetical protein
MRAPAAEMRKINIQTRSGYMRRNESFWMWEGESLDEARTKQFVELDASSRVSPRISSSHHFYPDLKWQDVMRLQIEPFYDPLRIHHAADQIDH